MTKQDTLKILAILKTAYPYFYKDATPQSAKDTLDLWATLFVDDDPATVGLAVKSFIAADEKGFPPVPGQIKAIIRTLAAEEYDSELKAWSMVRRALSNSQFNSKREFEKLPPIIQKTIGSAAVLREWCVLDSETVDVTIANAFLRSYRTELRHAQEIAALPLEAKAMLQRHQDAKRICSGKGNKP